MIEHTQTLRTDDGGSGLVMTSETYRLLRTVWDVVYGFAMLDVMAALKDRRAKAEAKVLRTTKILEIAKKELADLVAAERVMADITGESAEPKIGAGPVSDRDREIAKLLSIEKDEALSPVELYPTYTDATGDTINLDAFRTALWRLQKKVIRGSEKSWCVKSENGRYWREPADGSDEFDELLGEETDPETN